MQLPMFLRLLQLALALYYGDLGSPTDLEQPQGQPRGDDLDMGLGEGNGMVYHFLLFVYLFDGCLGTSGSF